MAASDLVVVEVVPGCDLQATAAKRGIDIVVGDHRDEASGERQPDAEPDKVTIAFVVRVHCDRGVAQHRFRSRGRDDQVTVRILHRVAQMPDPARFGLGHDLEVGERGMQDGVPVDEPLAAVDEAVLVQPDEHLGNRGGETLVHREAISRPVDRCTEPAHLAGDRSAGLLFPAPHAPDEFRSPERGAVLTLLVQLPLDHHLGCDARVIGACLPEHAPAFHPVKSRQRVHQRVLERVTHVQRAGYVRRRNHDAVRRSVARGREPSSGFPALVDARFNFAGRVALVHRVLRALKDCAIRDSPRARGIVASGSGPASSRFRRHPRSRAPARSPRTPSARRHRG